MPAAAPAPPADPARRKKLLLFGAIGGALVLAAIVVVVAAVALTGDKKPSGAAPPAAAPTTPAVAVQPYTDKKRNLTLNVPHGWQKNKDGDDDRSYTDFMHPTDKSSWLRVNVEPGKKKQTPRAFLTGAENYLKNKAGCSNYQQIAMRDAEMSGAAGAELEFTCGQRHGLWRAIVVNGTAYSVYLSVPETAFAEHKPLHDEAVKSFRLG